MTSKWTRLKDWMKLAQNLPDSDSRVVLKEVSSFVRKHKKRFLLINVLSPLDSAISGCLLLVLKRLFDRGFLPSNIGEVYHSLFVIVGLYVVQAAVEMVQTYATVRTFGEITIELKGRLYRKLLEKDTLPNSREHIGELMSRFSIDVNSFTNILNIVSFSLIRELFVCLVIFSIILSLNWQFAILAVGVYLLVIRPISRIGSKIRSLSAKYIQDFGESEKILYETIYGHIVIRTYGLIDHFISKYEDTNDRLAQNAVKSAMVGRLIRPLNDAAILVSICLLVFLGIGQITRGILTVGSLAVFLVALYKFSECVKSISHAFTSYQASRVSASRLVEILNRPTRKSPLSPVSVEEFRDSIVFEDVRFSYDNNRNVFDNLNLCIHKGDKVIISGKSGSGKSTILSLLLGLREPTAGRISIDDVDYRTIPNESLLRLFAYVSQEPIIFHASIQYNVQIGRLGASLEDIQRSCALAKADSVIEDLPQGVDTIVGERGQTLSGGERQRLTIARALLKDAQIVILDEATSSIDYETDVEIRRAIFDLFKEKTIVVITHRQVNYLDYDLVYCLENGTLIDKTVCNRVFAA